MPKFRKKPVVIDAVQLVPENEQELLAFVNEHVVPFEFVGAWTMVIHTLGGDMMASPGDWIIKGVQGEFYPCKPDIFEATYESVGEQPVEAGNHCTCGKGDNAPAIVHPDSCPCSDWIFGQLEGIEDDRGKNRTF